ncbi:MAG: radical SAM protein [Actinomycetota bacterium]
MHEFTKESIPVKHDRDEVFVEYTKSICPVCKAVLDAEVNIRDNRVYLRKRCPQHGPFEALVYSDAQMWLDIQRFNKPGTIPLATQTEAVDGCPLDCGMCPEHKQHACLGIIEVNTACNLDCPLCFADSGHQPDGFSLTAEQVGAGLDAFVRAEGNPEVVMFSGGEPTIHPQIMDFIAMAIDRGIELVTLNTNGIRLARDRAFVEQLASFDPKPRIYLQFDGLEEKTSVALRGRDLRALKQQALDRCAEAGLVVVLAAAVERGLNEHEVGEIVRFGIGHPAVRGVAFQPVTHSGRHPEFDPANRVTNADVIHGLARQLPEWFEAGDFVPVPCCFPACRSITYAIVDGEQVIPVTRLLDVEEHIDYLTNRVMPDPSLRADLEKLFSASAFTGSPATDARLDALGCSACGLEPGHLVEALSEKAFMIVIQDFQDPYTLNVRQLMKCCVSEIVPDGRLIPFCAYNSVGYREQVREKLSGVKIDPVVPNAIELGPHLQPTRYGSQTSRVQPANHDRDATNRGRKLT